MSDKEAMRNHLDDAGRAIDPLKETAAGVPNQFGRNGRRPAVAPWLNRFRWVIWLGAVCAVVALLHAWPHRTGIPPLIESDNAYIFSAADRMYAGQGPTTIPPQAPLQPWTWRSDWKFLTQWPVGYTAMICAARLVLGTSTASASVSLGVASCGLALVAWFAWFRACLPRGMTALLVAVVAAGASFSVENLVEPSSDTVLLAMTPLVLLLSRRALDWQHGANHEHAPSLWWMTGAGLACGALFWIRYAAVFVPLAVGVFLLIEWRVARRARFRQVLVFALTALVPMVALVVLNRACGDGVSTQEQLNLGNNVSFRFDGAMLLTAWQLFSRQTLYAHRPEASWIFAVVLPIVGVGGALLFRSSRVNMWSWFKSPPMLLSLVVVVTLPVFLIVVTAFFHGKYDYVGLDRYYEPVRPFYFLLFVGPAVAFNSRLVRAGACVGLIMVGSWFVNQDARRTFDRWLAAKRPATDYGRWAQRFLPHSREVHAWVAAQGGDDLVIFSNFHDGITLETGLPACPSPRDTSELNTWLERLRQARGVDNLRVFFVLDPDNDIRDYFLDPPAEIVQHLGLVHPKDVPDNIRQFVFTTNPVRL